MGTVFALLVGIDAYAERPLGGCVNDVRAAADWLRRKSGTAADIRTLTDAAATRAAVLEALGTHLGRGGPGDTALLWFSGHGSSKPTADPREATGNRQALVCHDSPEPGRQALTDRELGPLLDGIAHGGAHVVAVLDCCYSGGATRDGDGTARSMTWRSWWTVPGAPRGAGAPGPAPRRHVLLAASRLDETAHEGCPDGDRTLRGYFSHAVLEALETAGAGTSCRDLHALAEAAVRRRRPGQHPTLFGPGERRFLHGGTVPSTPYRMRWTDGEWEVNCGAAHGLRAEGSEFTVLTPGPPRRAVVRAVLPETSRVAPADWEPDGRERAGLLPVTPTALAFPPAAVTLRGRGAAAALAEAVTAHPLLSLGGPGTPLRVEVAGGTARVEDGVRAPAVLGLRTDAEVRHAVRCLAHLARWHRVRELENPDPTFSALVRVTVEPLSGTQWRTAGGELVHAYTPDGRPPRVRVRVHNDTDRPLWCVLLDLTDSHEITDTLYEGDFVGPGRAGEARGGAPVWLYLPEGRPAEPGASVRDWLKLIATEQELDTTPFRLPAWPPAAGARGGGPPGTGNILRLQPRPGSRDLGGPRPVPGRWGTVTVPLRTVVPRGPADPVG
ncbi:caspase family protein [Streptomyces sp. JJ36]|uniref:caspase family protein n=1 Tax=Streptomyces sp. JJ36 TaxID=2736645 RepID=UPI001F3C9026|nr:caspase family protein [Streptomyces sp. JJ36]MCF6523838.1 caspase family protein [Streptomyces sp. JJ36]